MLKHSFLAVLIAALLISVTACNDRTSSSSTNNDSRPNDAMRQVEAAFESLDAEKLKGVYEADTWNSDGEDMRKEFSEMKEKGEKVEISWTDSDVTVDGDTAKVKTKMTITNRDGKVEDETETFSFKKTAAGWKCTG